ncbi:MAG: hypothetical protein M3Q29_25390 [Chloroflexota bacterium]|nr:hypothetical protein [Chloroflexota bacterium]
MIDEYACLVFKYDQLEAENRELRAKLKEIDDLAGTDLICRDCGREIDFYDAEVLRRRCFPCWKRHEGIQGP